MPLDVESERGHIIFGHNHIDVDVTAEDNLSTANKVMNNTKQVLTHLDEDADRYIQDRLGRDFNTSYEHCQKDKTSGNFKQVSDQADLISFSSLKNLDEQQHSSLYNKGCDDNTRHQLDEPVIPAKHNGDQADLISFSSLKNLDEAKITQNAIDRYAQDSHSCDYDTLYEIQRQQADLTKMCTTSTTTKSYLSHQAYQDLSRASTKPKKANVIADPAAQFYNNFFGWIQWGCV